MGIHQAVINGPLLDPILLSNISENMIAYSQGAPIPNIINYSFQSVYGLTGGTGNTIGLLIAIFLFSKYKVYRDIGKLALAPGLFNINEPVIFGIPIVFNLFDYCVLCYSMGLYQSVCGFNSLDDTTDFIGFFGNRR